MKTFAEIIDGLGGYAEVAEGLGLVASTVSSMRTRDSVPPEHWPALVRFAEAKGAEGVTLDLLATIRRPRKQRDPAKAAPAPEPAPC